MFLLASIGGVITMLQIEQESSYLVAVSGKMLDDTFRNNPELYEWLPEAEDFKNTFHTAIDSAYIYGRDWAIKTVMDYRTVKILLKKRGKNVKKRGKNLKKT